MGTKKHRIKNFDDILEFLSQEPTKIISKLKKKKTFIGKWFEQYLDDLPQIEVNLRHFDETRSLHELPIWTDKFLDLISNICKECGYYNPKIGCKDDTQRQVCISIYKSLLVRHQEISRQDNNRAFATVEEEIEKITRGKSSNFSARNSLIYRCGLTYRKPSLDKILKRIKDDISYEKSNKKLYIPLTLSERTDKYKKNIITQSEKSDYLEDPNEWKNYSDGTLRKIKAGFPIFEINISFSKNFRPLDLENFFREIVGKILQQQVTLSLSDLGRAALSYVCLFYLFFWDLLNQMYLRNAPDLYEKIIRTNNLDEAVMILSYVQNREDEDYTDVNDFANQINSPSFNPNYQESHPYLFKSEKINQDQFFNLYHAINALMKTKDITSISEEDLQKNVRDKINRLVKDKEILRRSLSSDDSGVVLNSLENMDKADLKRHLQYKVFMIFIQFITSLTETQFRIQRPYFNQSQLNRLCRIIRENPDKNMKEIITECNLGNYSTVMEHLEEAIKKHPDFNNWKRSTRYGIVQDIIFNATYNANKKWITEITRRKN